MESSYNRPDYPEIFDTIVIGAGPAGITAAIYTARRGMSTLILCGSQVGGQMTWSSDVENYTGIKKISGPSLTDRFYHHLKKLELDTESYRLWICQHETAEKLSDNKGNFSVATVSGKKFKARTLILATGKKPRTLGIPGEEVAMHGHGLSFSVTSDAPLYKNRKMAIIGGGNSAMDVALQLTKFTDDITMFTDLDHLMGEEVLIEKIQKNLSVHLKYNIRVKKSCYRNADT